MQINDILEGLRERLPEFVVTRAHVPAPDGADIDVTESFDFGYIIQVAEGQQVLTFRVLQENTPALDDIARVVRRTFANRDLPDLT